MSSKDFQRCLQTAMKFFKRVENMCERIGFHDGEFCVKVGEGEMKTFEFSWKETIITKKKGKLRIKRFLCPCRLDLLILRMYRLVQCSNIRFGEVKFHVSQGKIKKVFIMNSILPHEIEDLVKFFWYPKPNALCSSFSTSDEGTGIPYFVA